MRRSASALLLALTLAQRMLATLLSPHVAEALENDKMARRLGDEVIKNLSKDDSSGVANGPAPLDRLSSYRLRMRERLRDRIAYVFHTIVMPRLADDASCAEEQGPLEQTMGDQVKDRQRKGADTALHDHEAHLPHGGVAE